MITGYVPGGFDMLHVGHLNILTEAAKRCDRLIAGVATDESLERMKGRGPIVPLAERMAMVAALRMVNSVVPDYDQDKRLAWKRSPFDVLFKGTDWEGTDKGSRLRCRRRRKRPIQLQHRSDRAPRHGSSRSPRSCRGRPASPAAGHGLRLR